MRDIKTFRLEKWDRIDNLPLNTAEELATKINWSENSSVAQCSGTNELKMF